MRGLAGLALLALSLGAIPLGRAQAPSMAGGVVYPAPEYAYWNPAFSALPAEDRGRGFSLPVGLLRLLPLFPDTSPLAYLTNPEAFRDRFDLLGFYAVLQNPYLFLLAPPRSPREVVFRLSGSRFSIEDAEGRPLALLEPGRGGEGQPLLLGLGYPLGDNTLLGLHLRIPAPQVGLSLSPLLEEAVRVGDTSPCRPAPSACTLTLGGSASASLGLSFAHSAPIAQVEGFRVYGGVRGEVFLGLLMAEEDLLVRPVLDSEGRVTGVSYENRFFLSHPGIGRGYGVRGDIGLALAEESGWRFGFSLLGLLDVAVWEGQEYVTDGNGTRILPSRQTSSGRGSLLVLSASRALDLGTGRLLLAGDARMGREVGFRLSGEFSTGSLRLGLGLGYAGGPLLGLGAGFEQGSFGLEAALGRFPAPLTGEPIYGLSLGVRF